MEKQKTIKTIGCMEAQITLTLRGQLMTWIIKSATINFVEVIYINDSCTKVAFRANYRESLRTV